MLRLGIIGAGGIASLHTHNILSGKCPEVQLTAMADRKESRREWIRATVPDAAVFCEGSDLIAFDTCDAVLIATPHYQHPTLAIEAFRHGKHVLCEKPAGVYTLQVRAMIAEADKHPELTFGMMFNQRTNCVYRKAKALIDSGALGEIKTGIARKATTMPGRGAQRGMARAAVCCSINARISWICCNGSVGCPCGCAPPAMRGNGTTSRWRTT